MPLPEPIRGASACDISTRWGIDLTTVDRLKLADSFFRNGEFSTAVLTRNLPSIPESLIISGFRSPQRQEELRREGRPTAPVGVSTHTSCPATGVDVRLVDTMDPVGNPRHRRIWAAYGRAAERAGLRWGGGSPIDERTGLPSDFNHFDLGRRQQ